jgi:hypothetical protein
MTHRYLISALALAVLALAGCTDQPTQQAADPLGEFLFGATGGSTRTVNFPNYSQAFGECRMVLGQYYTIEATDQDAGTIVCQPLVLTDGPRDRLLSTAPTRQRASIQIRQRGAQLTLTCRVELQRQISNIYSQLPQDTGNYSMVPNNTPAEVEGATTPDQNDTWETYGSDVAMEADLLNDIVTRLNTISPQPVD